MTGIRIQWVDGLAELLHGSLLTTPERRIAVPTPDVLDHIRAVGTDFIGQKSREQQHSDETVYTVYQWPESGPAAFGICWARNPKKEVDHATSRTIFLREFTETDDPRGDTISFHDLQQQLAQYALGHVSHPKLVR